MINAELFIETFQKRYISTIIWESNGVEFKTSGYFHEDRDKAEQEAKEMALKLGIKLVGMEK
jgi:hypothetical protein